LSGHLVARFLTLVPAPTAVNSVSEAEHPVPSLDARAALRWQQLPRSQSPWLHEELASRMIERLHWFREKPASWLHWEPLIGGVQAHQQLRALLPDAACHVAARQMLTTLQATRDPAVPLWNPKHWLRSKTPLPLSEDTRVGMLWANMQLHNEPLPLTLLQRWYRHIDTNGFLMFSCLGPDSLRELRAVYAQQGWPEPCQVMTDMHDWGDMLVHTGFAEPVMDMEHITLSYSTAQAMVQDLRSLGRNLHVQRWPTCRSRAWLSRLLAAIESHGARLSDGRLSLTLEVVYGHAFKPAPRARLDATTAVTVEDMRAMLRAGRR
jgi:malonyl-CoA O-methyltransferase